MTKNNEIDAFSVRDQYNDMSHVPWGDILRDNPDVFAALAGSVVKKKKKKGHKQTETRSLNALNLPEYAEVQFLEAFNVVWGGHTFKEMIEKTGLTVNVLQRLKSGERDPSFEEMSQIATGLGLDKAFFLEYRIGKVLASINVFLENNPETATAWFAKVNRNGKIVLK